MIELPVTYKGQNITIELEIVATDQRSGGTEYSWKGEWGEETLIEVHEYPEGGFTEGWFIHADISSPTIGQIENAIQDYRNPGYEE